MMPLLEVNQLSIASRQKPHAFLVEDLSFSLEAGKTLGLVGESGSGKSLTALSIVRFLPKTLLSAGRIRVGEHLVSSFSPQDMKPILRKEIGIVFQDPMSALNPIMSIGKQISEAVDNAHSFSEKTDIGLSWLKKMHIASPERVWEAYPHQLSGGQRQRIVIAMALCKKPKLLIADEITTALDSTTQAIMVCLLKELQQSVNMAILWISHDLSLTAQIADDIVVMQHGRLIEKNQAPSLLKAPSEPYTKQLLGALPENSLVNTELNASSTENVLAVKEISLYFPKLKALNQISFELYRGETLGVVGESGSGKSTLARAVMQLLPLTQGHIVFENKDLNQLSRRQLKRWRHAFQMIFQDPLSAMDPKMRMVDIVEEGLLSLKRGGNKEERKERIHYWVKELGLSTESLYRYPHEFSGGQRQRFSLVRALLLSPDLLVCDEATSSLDVYTQSEIIHILIRLQKEYEVSCLFITHQIGLLKGFAHRVAVMLGGRIVEIGEVEAVLKAPKHPYTQLLVAVLPSVHRSIEWPEGIHFEAPPDHQQALGCPFYARCPHAMAICQHQFPEAKLIEGRTVYCHWY